MAEIPELSKCQIELELIKSKFWLVIYSPNLETAKHLHSKRQAITKASNLAGLTNQTAIKNNGRVYAKF